MLRAMDGPPQLVKLEKDVQIWRQFRKLPCPMPAELWKRACSLARELGVRQVALALGLNQTSLKNRLAEQPGGACLATFVELIPPRLPVGERGADFQECVLEVDSIDGARLRVVLQGVSTENLGRLLRQFAQQST